MLLVSVYEAGEGSAALGLLDESVLIKVAHMVVSLRRVVAVHDMRLYMVITLVVLLLLLLLLR